MSNLISSFYKNYLKLSLPGLLILIGIILSYLNYTPGTWLSGWDTLHPEFNFSENINRSLSGVWRSEQGLGAIAAHSHMADLPRILFLWIFSLFLPDSFLRYLFFFVSLVVGPLGVYAFLNLVLPFKNNLSKNLSAFLGSCYYLFNLGTVQHFYVPFEMFATQFMFLPWIFYLIVLYIQKGSRKSLLLLSLVALLSAPQAYAATLFYAAFGSVFLFGTMYSLSSEDKKLSIKRFFVALLIISTTNLFWILPNLYSIINQSQVVESSRINELFSPEAFLRNKEYGAFKNIIVFKNFLFSWREFDFSQTKFVDLLDEWKKYTDTSRINALMYVTAASAIGGLIVVLLTKDAIGISLIPILLLCYFFIANDNPPFGFGFSWIKNNLPVFGEAFRTPFTKFSILLMFIFSYSFSYLWGSLYNLISKYKVLNILSVLLSFVIFITLFIPFKPAFEGNLISHSMRVNMPKEYKEAFNWFNNAPYGKIAKLPVHTHWGWIYYSWGFQGAGFTYFGTKSPQLDRDFDRWSAENESFYNELSFAVYSKNQRLFENVLQKYDISYLLLDESVINAGGSQDILFLNEIKEMAGASEDFVESAKYGFLTIYQNTVQKELVYAPQFIYKSTSKMTYSPEDLIYKLHGDYILGEGQEYPFVNLDQRSGIKFSTDKGRLLIKKRLNLEKPLNIPDIVRSGSITVATWATEKTNEIELRLALQSPTISDSKDELYSSSIEQRDIVKTGRDKAEFLSIDKEVFPLRLVTGQDVYVGSFNILNSPAVNFRLYSDKNTDFDSLVGEYLIEKPRSCADPALTIQPSNITSGIEINGGDYSLCLGRAFTAQSDGLLKVSFKSLGDIPPWYCLVQVGSEGCINSHVPNDFIKDGSEEKYTFYTPVSKGQLWLDFVVPENSKGKKLALADVSISLYPQIAKKEYSLLSNFTSYSKDEVIPLAVGNKEVTASISRSTSSKENFSIKRGFPDAYNCDIEKIGNVSKTYTGKSIIYGADDGGVSCDFFDYPELAYREGYILRIKGVNKKGRGLKVYVFNKITGNLVLEKLLDEGSFEEFMVLYPQDSEGRGYTVNVETRAFGHLESENEIQELEFIPIPISWLSIISIGESVSQTNSTVIENVNGSPRGFVTTLVNVPREDGLLVLSQSYEKGWVGIARGRILKHMLFNSWANAWELPQGEYTVYIIYWPQLLQYFGFGAAIVTILVLLFGRKMRLNKQSHH